MANKMNGILLARFLEEVNQRETFYNRIFSFNFSVFERVSISHSKGISKKGKKCLFVPIHTFVPMFYMLSIVPFGSYSHMLPKFWIFNVRIKYTVCVLCLSLFIFYIGCIMISTMYTFLFYIVQRTIYSYSPQTVCQSLWAPFHCYNSC